MNKMKKTLAAVALVCAMVTGLFVGPSLMADAATNEKLTYNALMAHKFTTSQATGIMANIYHESRFNPKAGGTFYGLVQWGGARKSSLRRYCSKHGLNSSSIVGQVSYLVHELKTVEHSAYSKVKKTANSAAGSYKSGYNFSYYYERPANKAATSRRRGSTAKNKFWSKYKGKNSVSVNVAESVKTKATKKTYTAGTYKVNNSILNVRRKPTVSSKKMGVLRRGQKIQVRTVKNGKWGMFTYQGKTCYVSLKLAKRV